MNYVELDKLTNLLSAAYLTAHYEAAKETVDYYRDDFPEFSKMLSNYELDLMGVNELSFVKYVGDVCEDHHVEELKVSVKDVINEYLRLLKKRGVKM